MRTLVETLLRRVEASGGTRKNIVAFSGGVDSSVVAALVQKVFPRSGTIACIGRSAALPSAQLQLAREVAAHIGIQLKEVATAEGANPDYVANEGMACFHCKTELYSTLEAVASFAADDSTDEVSIISGSSINDGYGENGGKGRSVVLFNGTNKEDRADPTRVGLIAANNFAVESPIDTLMKEEVRAVARHLGLPVS
jgi:uncharacterized protein